MDRTIIHAIAECSDCDWHENDYLLNVNELAMKHIEKTGHTVAYTSSVIIKND